MDAGECNIFYEWKKIPKTRTYTTDYERADKIITLQMIWGYMKQHLEKCNEQ